jgi:hypothetical protein
MSSEKGSVLLVRNLGWAVGQVLSDYKLSIRDICHVTNFWNAWQPTGWACCRAGNYIRQLELKLNKITEVEVNNKKSNCNSSA